MFILSYFGVKHYLFNIIVKFTWNKRTVVHTARQIIFLHSLSSFFLCFVCRSFLWNHMRVLIELWKKQNMMHVNSQQISLLQWWFCIINNLIHIQKMETKCRWCISSLHDNKHKLKHAMKYWFSTKLPWIQLPY